MKKHLLVIALSVVGVISGYSQPTNIYQPNGSATNFGKVAADSLNYYVVNYPALTLMKIDGSNKASLVTTLPADPFQTMIFNKGKGIFPVSAGLPFKLFDGTNQVDITGGQLPLAGYTGDKVIAADYFHIGNFTYFRTSNKIYKTDYTSAASIKTLATIKYTAGTTEMQHTANSIFFQDIIGTSIAPSCINRIDLLTGKVAKIDSSAYGSYDYGTVYNNDYYFCTPYGPGSVGKSKIYKVSDSGVKTVIYSENASNKHFVRIVGITPNGVIALLSTVSVGAEYVSISGGIVTSLNFNTVANSRPYGNVVVGSSRSAKSLVYFGTLDTLYTVNSTNTALWVTNGTLAGTKKVRGGPPATFEVSGLSPQFPGSAETCGNDLYFAGKNGANTTRLIYVDGNNYSVQTNSFGLFSTQPSIRKIANGIVMVGSPLPTSSAEKAVFKVTCSAITGIQNSLSNEVAFDIFPNPAKEQIIVSLSGKSEECVLKIYNMLGESVLNQILVEQTSHINLNLKPGLYFVNVLDDLGSKSTRKLIIQ
ncbi:MAG: T9SS type A sorting domain-containing protein [Prolixibacteraceae bacterium]|nr:T9SS type A sorting domain-containing protein [Prolixibacteraceae bacterium]